MRTSRRSILKAGLGIVVLGLGVLAGATIAGASEKMAFDQAKFDGALKAGKPVLLEVHASWCPVCKVQTPILGDLAASPKYNDVVRFNIDFDTQKDLLRTLNVQKQSTLIAFKGGKEVDRSTGVTDKAAIESLLAKAL